MSCTDNTCGTGGWTGPLPGDPDNNVTLRSRTVYGGISVSWSYPVVNSHAVAYTILYRGLENDFSKAIEIGRIGSSLYFDKLEPVEATTYYYWIRIVSINGTINEVVGPTSAIAEPLGKQTLETLTGLIDGGVLAQSLKEDIAGITLLNDQLRQEILDRVNSSQALATALAAVQSDTGEALTYILTETQQRTSADSAIVTQVNAIAAGSGTGNDAGLAEEIIVRADADEALSQRITTLTSHVDDGLEQLDAAIRQELTTFTTKDQALAQSITDLTTSVDDNYSFFTNKITSLTQADSSIAQDVSNLGSQLNTAIGTLDAAIQEETTARVNAIQGISGGYQAIAEKVTTVESALNGNVATGQVGLTTKVETINGAISEIGSLYTAKVQVNGLIGGFGVYNNGTEVEAGFDVDRFWIGRTGPDQVKPFIIDNGVVYINKARIRDADIDTLKIAGEAVTVPIVVSAPDRQRKGRGDQNFDVVNMGFINMTQAGMAYILVTSAQGFKNNSRFWRFNIRVNGQIVRGIMGGQANDAPVCSVSLPLPVGVTKVEVLWAAHPDVILGYNEIFMMGVKK